VSAIATSAALRTGRSRASRRGHKARVPFYRHRLGKIGAERPESAISKNRATPIYAEDADVLASYTIHPQQDVSTCQVLEDAARSLRTTRYSKNARPKAGGAFGMAKDTRIETARSERYTLHSAAA
jgi:hypothetical protein